MTKSGYGSNQGNKVKNVKYKTLIGMNCKKTESSNIKP